MKNFFTSTLLIAVIALGLTACWPQQTYDKNGLSFNYPGSWVVTEDEFSESIGYLALEKKDSDPTASIVYGWMVSDAEIGADMMLSGILQEMQSGEGLTDLVAQPATDVNYGQYPARAVTYTAKLDGAAVSGAVWVFKAEGRVMNIAVREGADGGNTKVFKNIRESFKLQ